MLLPRLLVAFGAVLMPGERSPGLSVEPASLTMIGPGARAQILATGAEGDRRLVDLTHSPSLRYHSLDVGVVRVDAGGRLAPTGIGATSVVVRRGDHTATVRVIVEDFAGRKPVSFLGEVEPIFSRAGCNAGSCHGKASGQNGFRLSLLGFDPRLDYESLVREGRGRRVFPAAPGASLLLLKPTAAIPHGGGRRFSAESPEARTLARWIAQGMPFESGPASEVVELEVFPTRCRIVGRGSQQLRVVARYRDGVSVDVTHLARYQANAPDLAIVGEGGRIETLDGIGEAAVLARFGGRVAIARVTIPNGQEPPNWTSPPSDNLIDPLVFGKLRELGIPPSGACTDAEFARRSSLDICGILPDPKDVVAFEASTDRDKRARWVDGLLERPEYADLFAMKWGAILRNKRSLGALSQPGTFAFHDWIREALAENWPYTRFVGEILTAKGDAAVHPPVVWYRGAKTVEEQVDDSAQLFLGLRLQCARCHHHPLEAWGQDDYYGFAALFARVGRKAGPDPVTPRVFVKREGLAVDPTTGRTYHPRVLGGPELKALDPDRDPRQELADWLGRPDNPYFARAVVNRYWKHFLGRGLVEPEDDMRASNPPANPELLDALADDFVRHGHDLKHLVRTIATSLAYDRSSLAAVGNESDRRNFARFYARRLPAEVLLDAISTVSGTPAGFDGLPPSFRATQIPDDGVASAFLDAFGRPKRESVCECERSAEPDLSQGLLLLTSPELQRQLNAPDSRASRWTLDPRPDASKVEELYRLAFSRPPTSDELALALSYLAQHREDGYEDLIWAVINTKEFLFNH